MLGLGRPAVTERAPLQPNDEVVVDVANVKIASHL
jgi:hypothetical protein